MNNKNRFDVEKIANLAKIKLSNKEKTQYRDEFLKIIELVSVLKELDIENVKSINHPLDSKNKIRKDKVKRSLTQKEALQNAPDKAGSFFCCTKNNNQIKFWR